MIIKGFGLWLLLLYISIFGYVQGENERKSLLISELNSNEANHGHITFYIRQSCDYGKQSRFTRIYLPYIRLQSQKICQY